MRKVIVIGLAIALDFVALCQPDQSSKLIDPDLMRIAEEHSVELKAEEQRALPDVIRESCRSLRIPYSIRHPRKKPAEENRKIVLHFTGETVTFADILAEAAKLQGIEIYWEKLQEEAPERVLVFKGVKNVSLVRDKKK